jgi:hypothetical protein
MDAVRTNIDKLIAVVDRADELPAEVQGAMNDLLASIGKRDVPWYKAPFFKNGEFSKTALFATLANMLVLIAYVLSWFAGAQLTIGSLGTWTIPPFDTGAAAAILAIVNGTYIGNRLAAGKENGNG